MSNLQNEKWVTKIIVRLQKIEKYGDFGKKSHRCRAKNDIFEIVFDGIPLRIYFTVVDDKHIQLEDGSTKKDGGGHGGQQERVIAALDKLISLRS